MKITARGEYGSRAMIELAAQWGRGLVPLSALAAKQEIPRKYLEQVIAELRNAGLVEAGRGARGGYQLARDPSEITLLDVVQVLEGPISIMECQRSEDDCCGLWGGCGLRDTWSEVEAAARRVMQATSLKSLAERQIARERRGLRNAARGPLTVLPSGAN